MAMKDWMRARANELGPQDITVTLTIPGGAIDSIINSLDQVARYYQDSSEASEPTSTYFADRWASHARGIRTMMLIISEAQS